MANGLFGGGDGTLATPYLIEDVADFIKLNDYQSDRNIHFKLANDISFKSIDNWTPISFCGQFDGGFHKLSDITCVSPDNAAIFQSIYTGSSFVNVFLENIYIENTDTYEYAAILVVYANNSDLTFRNISVQGTVKSDYAAGFAYQINAVVENVGVNVDIQARYYGSGFVHQLDAEADIKNCYVKGSIRVLEEGREYGNVNGFVYGINEGAQIRNIAVFAKLSFEVPLTGSQSGKVHPFSNEAYPSSWGYGKYTLENILIDLDTKGPLGGWKPDLTYSTGPFWYVRGVDGKVYRNTDYQSAGAAYEPGVGASWSSYWEEALVADAEHESIDYKTTDQMRSQATFATFDFTNVWQILEGQSYPSLKFEGPPSPPHVVLEQYVKINGNWMLVK